MVTWEELTDWSKDWTVIDSGSVEKRRELFYRTSFMERGLLARAIQDVRIGRNRLVRDRAYGYADALDLDSGLATTPDLDRVLAIAVGSEVSEFDTQRWFEGLGLFDQAVALSKIEINDPYETVGRDAVRLVDLLSQEVFSKGTRKTEFYVYHDPKREFKVSPDGVGVGKHLNRPGLRCRLSRLSCRVTADGHLMLLCDRVKDAFGTWLKIQRQLKTGECKSGSPYEIFDRCGFMFVLSDIDVLNVVMNQIVDVLLKKGASLVVEPESNHDSDTKIDSNNSASSANYKATKVVVFWQGRYIELQFMTFYDYFSSRHSVSRENHELYKVRQAYDYSLPLLWPHELYGINWSHGTIHTKLEKWKEAQLGWRVNGKASSHDIEHDVVEEKADS